MREVRLQPFPVRFTGCKWETEDREIVLVESDAWVLVRRADSPQAMPYVVSRKEWNRFQVKPHPPQEPTP